MMDSGKAEEKVEVECGKVQTESPTSVNGRTAKYKALVFIS